MSRTLKRYMLALAAAGVLITAACAPGATTHPAASQATTPVQTNAATLGSVTLTEWDNRTVAAQSAAQDKLNAAFEHRYPNVRIKRVSRNFNDLKTSLKLALSANNPPDVVQVNQGYADLAAFVQAGLLLPQDRYAQTYGWTQRYNPTLLAQNRVTSDGHAWGTGQLYGISNVAELVGVYYNKALLARLHRPVPRTLADLQSDLAAAKSAGILPIELGTSNKSAAIHIFGMLQALIAGPTQVNDLVFGRNNARWDGSATLSAATTLATWSRRGYFPTGVNGQTDQDMADHFGSGAGLFMIDGMWWAPQEQKALGSKVGFTVLRNTTTSAAITEGGLSLLWGITAKALHPDAAAAYINFINSPQAEDVIAQGGDNPAATPASYRPPAGSLQADVTHALGQVVPDGTLMPYIDYTTPDMYDVAGAGIQEVLGGQRTPQQLVSTLQQNAQSFKASR